MGQALVLADQRAHVREFGVGRRPQGHHVAHVVDDGGHVAVGAVDHGVGGVGVHVGEGAGDRVVALVLDVEVQAEQGAAEGLGVAGRGHRDVRHGVAAEDARAVPAVAVAVAAVVVGDHEERAAGEDELAHGLDLGRGERGLRLRDHQQVDVGELGRGDRRSVAADGVAGEVQLVAPARQLAAPGGFAGRDGGQGVGMVVVDAPVARGAGVLVVHVVEEHDLAADHDALDRDGEVARRGVGWVQGLGALVVPRPDVVLQDRVADLVREGRGVQAAALGGHDRGQEGAGARARPAPDHVDGAVGVGDRRGDRDVVAVDRGEGGVLDRRDGGGLVRGAGRAVVVQLDVLVDVAGGVVRLADHQTRHHGVGGLHAVARGRDGVDDGPGRSLGIQPVVGAHRAGQRGGGPVLDAVRRVLQRVGLVAVDEGEGGRGVQEHHVAAEGDPVVGLERSRGRVARQDEVAARRHRGAGRDRVGLGGIRLFELPAADVQALGQAGRGEQQQGGEREQGAAAGHRARPSGADPGGRMPGLAVGAAGESAPKLINDSTLRTRTQNRSADRLASSRALILAK